MPTASDRSFVWNTSWVFIVSSRISHYLAILPSSWSFFKIRAWSFPPPESLQSKRQISPYCCSGSRGHATGCSVYWEHFFSVKMLSEVLATSSVHSHSGLWWLKRKWGSGSNFDSHPVFRILASLSLPRSFCSGKQHLFSMEQRFLESSKAILEAPCMGQWAGSEVLEAPWVCLGQGGPQGQAQEVTPHPHLAEQASNRNLRRLSNYEGLCSPKATDLYLALLGTHFHLFGPLFVTCKMRIVNTFPSHLVEVAYG